MSHNSISASNFYFPLPCWLTKPRLYRSRRGGNAETIRSAVAKDVDSRLLILNPTGPLPQSVGFHWHWPSHFGHYDLASAVCERRLLQSVSFLGSEFADCCILLAHRHRSLILHWIFEESKLRARGWFVFCSGLSSDMRRRISRWHMPWRPGGICRVNWACLKIRNNNLSGLMHPFPHNIVILGRKKYQVLLCWDDAKFSCLRKGALVTSRRKIAWHYVRSWFFVDVIVTLIDMILELLGSSNPIPQARISMRSWGVNYNQTFSNIFAH